MRDPLTPNGFCNISEVQYEEIAHILCRYVEEEVSCDTLILQSTDPHCWSLDPAAQWKEAVSEKKGFGFNSKF